MSVTNNRFPERVSEKFAARYKLSFVGIQFLTPIVVRIGSFFVSLRYVFYHSDINLLVQMENFMSNS